MPGEFYIEGKREKVDISKILADIANLEKKLVSLATPVDFWSIPVNVIDLPAIAAHINLPDVIVSGLEQGISPVRVLAVIKVRAIENTNAGGWNAINGSQTIRVKKSLKTWGVDDFDAINLPDDLWMVAASTRESGDLIIGVNDLKSSVDGEGTYNFRFDRVRAELDYLRLNDVMIGLRFYLRAQ